MVGRVIDVAVEAARLVNAAHGGCCYAQLHLDVKQLTVVEFFLDVGSPGSLCPVGEGGGGGREGGRIGGREGGREGGSSRNNRKRRGYRCDL